MRTVVALTRIAIPPLPARRRSLRVRISTAPAARWSPSSGSTSSFTASRGSVLASQTTCVPRRGLRGTVSRSEIAAKGREKRASAARTMSKAPELSIGLSATMFDSWTA